MRTSPVLGGAILLLSTSGGAVAQPTAIDAREFQVNTFTTGLQGIVSVARNTNGSFVVAWTSRGSAGTDTSGLSVQARRYDAEANAVGSQFQVNTYTTDDQILDGIASDADGNFVVVWTSYGSWGGDSDWPSVQARRFRADGDPLDVVERQVNTYTTGRQAMASVAADVHGNFVVAWESYGSFGTDSSYYSIQARRFSADGTPLDPQELQVNTYTTDDQRFAVVASRPDGDFVIVWSSYGSLDGDDSYQSIQARRFAFSGDAIDGVEFQVNAFTPGPQQLPEVAVAPNGDFVVVWESYFGPGTDPWMSVQARRFGASGEPRDSTEFQVNEYTSGGQLVPRVGVDAEGDFLVAWESSGSFGTDGSGSSVQGRRYRTDGVALDAQEFQVNAYTPGFQFVPRVATGPDGDFVVAWTSWGSYGDDPDESVQARRFGRPAIVVTSTSGETGGPGCTLRDAITAATTDEPAGGCPAGNAGAVIELPRESRIALMEVDEGVNALPEISRPVTIRGRGSRIERDPGLACPVGPELRLFEVTDGGILTLDDVTVANGCLVSDAGAGVFVDGGSLILREASIEGNETGAAGGGLALVGGNLLAFDSTVRGNLAGASGGGIDVSDDPGILLIERTTLSENVAATGGGLSLSGPTSAWVRNSTISGNAAAVAGGGVELAAVDASLVLDFSTVTGNSAATGAGTNAEAGTYFLHGSLVGENLLGADCAAGGGSFEASGLSLDTDGSCAGLAGGAVATVASLGLTALADNGGFGRTHLPLAGSPALDAAPACTTRSGQWLATDGRRYPRPTDDDGDGQPACELGAVERGPLFLDGFERGDARNWSSSHR